MDINLVFEARNAAGGMKAGRQAGVRR